MKAKRILSILLTGSMLLSLLPVSALAAAPVFDAPAQTTAKKAAPLVQEADASRNTEEEAATRSSRDLDAENDAASIIPIELKADGTPEKDGNVNHWSYASSINYAVLDLYSGTFTLKPTTTALHPDIRLDIRHGAYGYAEFNGGTVGGDTRNGGGISGGTFKGAVDNNGGIFGGTFCGNIDNYNYGTISGGQFNGQVDNGKTSTIHGGTFSGNIDNYGTITGGTFSGNTDNYGNISGGQFNGQVDNKKSDDISDNIYGGQFNGQVDNNGTIYGGLFSGQVYNDNGTISGGYFVNIPEGSNTDFAAVSDPAGRTFRVPVKNGVFSESGYEKLYVPCTSSITVKTETKLIGYLVNDDSTMRDVTPNYDDSYTINVGDAATITLVTKEPETPPTPPTPPEPDNPDKPSNPDNPDSPDTALSSGAVAVGAVVGAAGLGYLGYVCGTSLYLRYTLPDGVIPATQQELATVLWTAAGKPDPVSTALYTDIPADNLEQQKAARWCVEQGLLSDHGATFGPDTKVTNARIIRAWNSLKKVPVTITN